MKLTKGQRARQEELSRALDVCEAALEQGLELAQEKVDEALKAAAVLVRDYNTVRQQAKQFASEVASQAQDEFDDHSDTWQSGERGEAARAFAEQWDEVAVVLSDDVAAPVLPRVELDETPDVSTALRQAPQEAE